MSQLKLEIVTLTIFKLLFNYTIMKRNVAVLKTESQPLLKKVKVETPPKKSDYEIVIKPFFHKIEDQR